MPENCWHTWHVTQMKRPRRATLSDSSERRPPPSPPARGKAPRRFGEGPGSSEAGPAAVAASARDRTRRHLHEVELLQTAAARSSDELTPLSPSCPSRLRLRQPACTTASDESGSPRNAARIAC